MGNARRRTTRLHKDDLEAVKRATKEDLVSLTAKLEEMFGIVQKEAEAHIDRELEPLKRLNERILELDSRLARVERSEWDGEPEPDVGYPSPRSIATKEAAERVTVTQELLDELAVLHTRLQQVSSTVRGVGDRILGVADMPETPPADSMDVHDSVVETMSHRLSFMRDDLGLLEDLSSRLRRL